MIKLMKKLRKRDWISMTLIVALTVLEVWCMMLMTDYMSDLIQNIMYLYYQGNPGKMGLPDSAIQSLSAMGGWSGLDSLIQSGSPLVSMIPAESAPLIHSIATVTTGSLWVSAAYMLLTIVGYVGCQVVIAAFASGIAASFAVSLRHDLNEKISSFSLSELNHFSTASLITRTTNDVEQVQMAWLFMMRSIFAAPVTAIWAICKIQASSSQLTITTGIFIAFLIVSLAIIGILVIPKFQKSQKYLDRLNMITREQLNGIRVVRAYNAEPYQEKKFQKANDDLTSLNLFTGHAVGLMMPLMIIVMDGISLAVYWVGAGLVNDGKTTYATLSSYSMLVVQIVMAFLMLLMMFILIPRARVSAKRINEVLETPSSIQNPSSPEEPREEGTIEFKDVSFRYPDSKEDTLSHISFTAKKGDTIAIIGSTGSGKTTLVDLLDRFYDVSEGEVLIDGVDVKKMNQDTLRGLIGFVPQKGVLFSGTVRSNIGLGKKEITDEEVKEASRISCSEEFLAKTREGYDLPIAQGGTNVSGGQRQRLCIARAVALKPQILVFDDSFSALDFKTDLAVRTNLKNSLPESTKVIVAQRIGTIMEADEILVLDEGKLVGKGKHEELLKNCQTYRDIALSQLSKEELGL